jgi:predicted peptidase
VVLVSGSPPQQRTTNFELRTSLACCVVSDYESFMHKTFAVLGAALSAAAFSGCSTVQPSAQERSMTTAPDMQTSQRFQKTISRTVQLDYLLFLPDAYKKSGTNKWPLMLFLHGAGERGTNLAKVAFHGPPKLVKAKKDFPFVLVSPQCPDERTWRDDELLALLDHVMAKHNVDTNRVYVTGLSMGGYASWSLGTKYPERFAAVVPICGGGEQIPVLLASPVKKKALQSMGVWAFHGAKDPTVALEESQRMTNALMRAGCKDVKLTVYPEAQHDSWTRAYNEPEIWDWFLAHRRGK